MNAFVRYGPAHGAAILVTLALAVALIAVARRGPSGRVGQWIGFALALVLVANKGAELVTVLARSTPSWRDLLPMHLCDWATLAAIVALTCRSQVAYELGYFWGLGGTLQGALTPDLPFGFPDLRCVMFFVSHCGIIAAVLFLTFGLRMRPARGAILRAMLWCQVYLCAAVLVNLLLGTNYGYLCRKPVNPSLLDVLAPWPIYILQLEVVALGIFALLYLPFLAAARLQHRKPGLRPTGLSH